MNIENDTYSHAQMTPVEWISEANWYSKKILSIASFKLYSGKNLALVMNTNFISC